MPHRGSFSPDAAYYVGPRAGGKFLEGAPILAVEVRSERDYGPAAERETVDKRADYFAAGTRVGWDVDVLREGLIRVYRATEPERPAIYRRGESPKPSPPSLDFGWQSTSFSNSRADRVALTFPDPKLK